MQSQTTSRNAALDYLLAIGNLIALADHKEEQIMNLMEEHDSAAAIQDISPEQLKALQDDIRKDIVQTSKDRDALYELRKDFQRNFFERYNIDKDYRCQFKHFAVALTAAEECRNADPTFQNDTAVIKLRTLVYRFLGTAMGVGPADCGRCLADAWDSAHEAKSTADKLRKSLPEKYFGPFRVRHDDGSWWIRKYKVLVPVEEKLGDRTPVGTDLGDGNIIVCKDLTPEQLQIPVTAATPIEADVLEPTPIEYGWTQSEE